MRRPVVLFACLIALSLALPGRTLAATAATRSPACHAVAHHIDPARSGFSCTPLPTTLTRKWSVTLNGATSYPLIANGKVFVTTSNAGGSYGGWLYGLNATDGSVAWGPVPLSGTYYYFTLAADNGRIFVNDFDGTVRAFDAESGAQLWATPTSYFSGEPVATSGMIWIQGASSVYGLSEQTGQILVQSPSLDGDGAHPAVDSTGVYLSTGCESQYRLTLQGDVAWVYNNGCSGGGSASTALWKRLMFGSDGNYVMRKDTGQVVSTFSGSPAFAGLAGFFGVDNAVFAQNVKTGVPMWTASLPGTVLAGPVATTSAVYVATSTPSLVALDPFTGAVQWSLPLPGQPGGGGQYFACPSDMAAGDSLVVVPTGAIVTAFG